MKIAKATSNCSEEQERFKEGELSLLGELFCTYYQELFYYGIKLVAMPEMVKDTIQDLFIDLWRKPQNIGKVKNLKAYLISSFRHELIRRIGQFRKESPVVSLKTCQFEFSQEDFLIAEEENTEYSEFLSQSLKGLTERQREVILLRFFHNLEFPEMSRILLISIQSVRNLLFRALDKIRKDLSEKKVSGFHDVEIFLLHVFLQLQQRK